MMVRCCDEQLKKTFQIKNKTNVVIVCGSLMVYTTVSRSISDLLLLEAVSSKELKLHTCIHIWHKHPKSGKA